MNRNMIHYQQSKPRRLIAFLATAMLTLSAQHAYAQTQTWPTKPVKIVIGFAPGGSTDVMARVLAQSMTESVGQPVIVDNKPGASGSIGAAEVARAAPDGYTFLLSATSVETANPYLFKTNVLPSRDLTPVMGLGRTQMYLVSRPGLEVNDVNQLIKLSKSKPGKMTYASSGAGSPSHLAGELFKKSTDTFLTHIPYRGSGPALADLMSDQVVDINFDSGVSFPHVRSGKLKLLAVASEKKSPFFPDVPTFADLGIKNASLDIWFGLWAPNNTPPEILTAVTREMNKALAQSGVKQKLGGLGAEAMPMDNQSFKKLLADEGKLLSALIKERGIATE